MSRKHLKRDPQYVAADTTWWYYETNHGLDIYVDRGVFEPPKPLTLSWSRIRAALARKDRKP